MVVLPIASRGISQRPSNSRAVISFGKPWMLILGYVCFVRFNGPYLFTINYCGHFERLLLGLSKGFF